MTKPALFFIWLVAMGASVSALGRLDAVPPMTNRAPVGRLERPRGDVYVRREFSSVWDSAAATQDVVQGDVVSTEADSTAEIALFEGAKLEVQPSSQFVVSVRSASDGRSEYIVTLLKGAITVAEGAQPQRNPLKIRGRGGEEIEVESLPKPLVIAKKLGEPVRLDSAQEAKSRQEEPDHASVRFAGPAGNMPSTGPDRYWSTGSLARGTVPPFPLTIAGRAGIEELIIRSESGEARLPLPGGPAAAVDIPRDLIKAAAAKTAEGENVILDVAPDGDGASPIAISLTSVDRFGDGPVAVHVAGALIRPAASTGWLPQLREIGAADADVSIFLESAADLGRLLPVVARSQGFTVESGAFAVARGIFLVRGGRVVARIAAREPSQELVSLVLDRLGGELAYEGTREAWLRLPNAGPVEGGEDLYALIGGRLKRVDKMLLHSSASAWRLVTDAASALFTSEVRIWAAR
jgi:hypothetical protein